MASAVVVFLLALVSGAVALTGYDCGRRLPNITTISLEDVASCQYPEKDPDVIDVNMQLLQRVEHTQIYVRMCRVKVTRTIKYCDWQGYASTIESSTFYHIVIRDHCDDMHKYGQLDYEKHILRELKRNGTSFRNNVIIAGSMDNDGDCHNGEYRTGNRLYQKVVVSADLQIDMIDRLIPANRDTEELILPSGSRCPLSLGKCTDADNYQVFWTYTPIPPCDFDQFVILFEGVGKRVTDNFTRNSDVYFANTTNGIEFALTKVGGEMSVCGYTVYRTEQANLFITEFSASVGFPRFTRKQIEVEDILITAYFNTKIAFLGKHIKSQFTTLYRDIVMHRCRLERQVLKNSLMNIHNSPDIMALEIMKERGYMAMRRGDVAHIISCEPTSCDVRSTEKCYQEIPVTCNNESYFLKPRTYIMIRTGTELECNGLLPTIFKIDGTWHQFTPQISRARDPEILKPLMAITWKFENLNGLVSKGIYPSEDLEKLRKHLLFPIEKQYYLDDVARKLSGKYNEGSSKLYYSNLLDQSTIETIAESKFKKLWDGFTQFGIYSAAVMGMLTIFHMLKLVADTLVRGYTLKKMYGWSIHLFAAVWGAFTHFIIATKPVQKKHDPSPSAPELTEMQVHGQNHTIGHDTSEVIDMEEHIKKYLTKASS